MGNMEEIVLDTGNGAGDVCLAVVVVLAAMEVAAMPRWTLHRTRGVDATIFDRNARAVLVLREDIASEKMEKGNL